MKKISYIVLIAAALAGCHGAHAASRSTSLTGEVKTGLDVIGARANAYTVTDDAPGALGREVYVTTGAGVSDEYKMFIPTSMYVRAGGGVALPFASSDAKYNGADADVKSGYTTRIGLGFNNSSFVRTELDFQFTSLKFKDTDDKQAAFQTIGGMLYFDLLQRYVASGDVTYRRWIVPFIGVGAAVGHYNFDGASGADGAVFAAPRGELGLNLRLTDVIGVDVAYQYQLMIGDGYGWNDSDHANGISNVIASFRVNF